MFCEREVYAKGPLMAEGALRPKKKADKSSLTRNGSLRGLTGRNVSWVASK